MPYNTNSELPSYIKDYSNTRQSQWRHIFNSTYQKVLSETKDSKQAEKRAFMAANAVVKRTAEKNSESANSFNIMINKWLGNIR